MAVYQVSGEYATLHAAARASILPLRAAAMESLTALRRGGADILITYFVPQVLKWLAEGE